VKIRGNRIELGEIESHLSKYPFVKEAAVIVSQKGNDKFLVAYYAAHKQLESGELRSFLSANLPAYMVPAYYVSLQSLPVNSNGKLNRNALPSPEIKKGDDYLAASNSIQEKLVAIWADVLKLDADTISIYANFFESGGHSINIIALCRKVNDVFGCEISVAEMFRLPTIKSMEEFIGNGERQNRKDAGNIEEAIDEANENLRLLEGMFN
jgi:acyl carrier protein